MSTQETAQESALEELAMAEDSGDLLLPLRPAVDVNRTAEASTEQIQRSTQADLEELVSATTQQTQRGTQADLEEPVSTTTPTPIQPSDQKMQTDVAQTPPSINDKTKLRVFELIKHRNVVEQKLFECFQPLLSDGKAFLEEMDRVREMVEKNGGSVIYIVDETTRRRAETNPKLVMIVKLCQELDVRMAVLTNEKVLLRKKSE
ncbi:hypothetical protein BFW01_g1689 [Lasiodiplodia theobromae]|nr:hypothetical protein BFW01_g1689 [Lasiodiplodia theobromae]